MEGGTALSGKLSPREFLIRTHNDRSIVRSVIGCWVESLDEEGRARFSEYLDAYTSLPEVGLPDLSHALGEDDVLGQSYPKISNESLGKWIKVVHGQAKGS
jgi:hypothetical protein